MLGLLTTSQIQAQLSNNARRSVFYQYPNGTMPLMGLLSLTENAEEVDKPVFAWHEERYEQSLSYTKQANSAGPFTDTSGASGAAGTDLTAAGWSKNVGDVIRIVVADSSKFRVRDVVRAEVEGTGSTTKLVQGIVDAVWEAQNTIDVRLVQAVSNALNTTANNGKQVLVVGVATSEGAYSKDGGYNLPIDVSNNTQIFRTVVGPFSRNVLKEGVKFDSTGIYKDAAKKAHIRHMEAMEKAMYFGIRGTQNVVDPVDGKTKPERTFGGLEWFLTQWEKGNTTNGGAFDYRTGADVTGQSWTNDDKRILDFGGSAITATQMESVIERLFRYNSDTGFEKLFVGGSGVLAKLNAYFEAKSIKVTQIHDKETTYGMTLTMWETLYGTLYFKSHPLFNMNPLHRDSGFFVDLGSIKYHPFQDSDTELLTNRHANDFDGRKDEWLTEFGPEFYFIENNMMIKNFGGVTV